MDIRYIADTHLFYADSLSWRNMSLGEYAQMLISNYNSIVQDSTLVLWVGDIGEYCQQTIDVLKQLRGRKTLIIGNHDLCWQTEILKELFEDVTVSARFGNILVQHIPPDDVCNAEYIIHGHHHEYDSPSMRSLRNSYLQDRTRLNCAADLNGGKPCTLRQLLINKETYREKVYRKDTDDYE